MACKYLVDNELYTLEELTTALRNGVSFKETPQLVETDEAPTSKYDVLASLNIQAMLGNLPGTAAEIFADYKVELQPYGITLKDITNLVDVAAAAKPAVDKPAKKKKTTAPKVSPAVPKADIPVATKTEKKSPPKPVDPPKNEDGDQPLKAPPARAAQQNKHVPTPPKTPAPPSLAPKFKEGGEFTRRGKTWKFLRSTVGTDKQTYLHFQVDQEQFVEVVPATANLLTELETVRNQRVDQEFYDTTPGDVDTATTIESVLGRKLNTNTHKALKALEKIRMPWRKQQPKKQLEQAVRSIKKLLPNIQVEYQDLSNVTGRDLRTPDGRVYGIVADGRILLDPIVATAETAFHEMGHVWAIAASAQNPALYNKMLASVNGSAAHRAVAQNPDYADLTHEQQLEEAFAMVLGRRMASRAQTSAVRSAVRALLDWISAVFNLGYNLQPDTSFGDLLRLANLAEEQGKPLVELTTEELQELPAADVHRMMISAARLAKKNLIQDLLQESIIAVGEKFRDSFTENDPAISHNTRIPSTREHDLYAVDTRPAIMATADPAIRDSIQFVSSSILQGKTVNFTIADALRTGTVPGTDIEAKGGLFFPYLPDNVRNKVAWASIDKIAAGKIAEGAKNTDYTIVTTMDRTALYSNEIALRRGIQAIKQLPANKQKQLLKAYNDSMVTSSGKPVDERKDLAALGKFASWDQLYEVVRQQSVKTRANAFTHIFPSGTNITPILAYSKMAVKFGIPTSDSIFEELAEPGAADIPVGYAAMVLKLSGEVVDMREEHAKYGMKKEDVHPNYPYYLMGEVVGVLEDAVPAYLLSDDYASRVESAAGRLDSKTGRLLTQANVVNGFTTSLMHAGSSNSFHIQDADTSVSRFFTYLTGAFPNVPVKIADNTSAREEILARQEGIVSNATSTVYGFIDEEGTLNMAHKHLSAQSAVYHIARVYTAFLRNNAPELLQRGIDLVKETPNPYYDAYQAAYTKHLPDDAIAEMALAHFVGDRGAGFFYNSIGVAAEYFEQYPEWVITGEREATRVVGKYSDAKKKEAEKTKWLTLKNDVIMENVRQYRDRFKEWENTLMSTVASIQGISDVPSNNLSSMTLEEYSEAFFADIAGGQPIIVGDHTTAQYTQQDLQRAREIDSVRYQKAEEATPYDNADRIMAQVSAALMEAENVTPGDIFESTSWYRNTFGAWTYDPDKNVAPNTDIELPGYELSSRIDRAKAMLATATNVDKYDRVILASQLDRAVPPPAKAPYNIPNPDAMQVVDDHIRTQTDAGLPLDLDGLGMHPALQGASPLHLQTRAQLIRETRVDSRKKELQKKYRRENKAPKTFEAAAKAVVGKRSVTSRTTGSTSTHKNAGSLSLAVEALGGNPFAAAADSGYYIDGEIHVLDGADPRPFEQRDNLSRIGHSSEALTELYEEFQSTPGIIDTGDVFTTLTEPSNIQKLRKLPTNIMKALRNIASRFLGNAEAIDSTAGPAVQEWLTRAGERSFAEAFSRVDEDVRFSMYRSEEDAAGYQQEVLQDILQNPEVDPASWLVLLQDDLYSGKLNRTQFDDFMALRQAMVDGQNITNTPLNESQDAAREIGKYYNEREAFMAGDFLLANRYMLEIQASFTEEEMRNMSNFKSTNIRELMEKAARHDLANPINAMNFAQEWLLMDNDDRSASAVQQLAMGLARKKVSATVAFLEAELLVNDDPIMRRDLRQAREMEKMMSAALVAMGSTAGLSLGVRGITAPTGLELDFDTYVEQVEQEIFRDNPANQRAKKVKNKFTVKERQEFRRVFDEAKQADKAVQNLQREMQARLDNVVAVQAAQTLRLWRAKGTPLSDKEIQAIAEALRAADAVHSVRRSIAGAATPLVGQRINFIRTLAEHMVLQDPTINDAASLLRAIQQIAPDVTLQEVQQVLVYSNPQSAQAITQALETQKKNISRLENTFNTLDSKMREAATLSAQGPTAARTLQDVLNEIGPLMTTALGIISATGANQPQYMAAHSAMASAYLALMNSLSVPNNGNASVDATAMSTAFAALADARRLFVGSRSVREARLDALIARARAGDMSVIAELAPKPMGTLTPDEAALQARLFEKRRALKNFYEAHRPRTAWEKLGRATDVLSNTYRTFAASLDLSMVFIQNWPSFARLFNPIRVANQILGRNTEWQEMADALHRGIKAAYREIRGDESETLSQYALIQTHPLYGYAVSAGVEFTTPKTIGGIEEELFRESLIDVASDYTTRARRAGIAGAGAVDTVTKGALRARNASEAVFLTYLNLIRIEAFNAGYQALRKSAPGYTPTAEDLEELAAFVNTNTGRGKIPAKLQGISSFMWAAKLAVSPFQFMANAVADPIRYGLAKARSTKGTPEERQRHEFRAALFRHKMTVGWGAITGAAVMTQLGMMAVKALCADKPTTFSTDPRNNDFMKVRCGRMGWAPLGPLTSAGRFATQFMVKALEGAKLIEKKETSRNKFFNDSPIWEVISRFLWGKTSPGIQVGISTFTGQDYKGDPTGDTFVERLWLPSAEYLAPIAVADIGELAFSEQAADQPLLATISAAGLLIGLSTQLYDSASKNQDNTVNEYLGKIEADIPNMNLGDKALRKKSNPKLYTEAKEEYVSAMIDWLRDEIRAGREPTKAQMKVKARQLNKQLKAKYLPKAK